MGCRNFGALNCALKLLDFFSNWISCIHLVNKILLLVNLALSQHVVLVLLKVSATEKFLLHLIMIVEVIMHVLCI